MAAEAEVVEVRDEPSSDILPADEILRSLLYLREHDPDQLEEIHRRLREHRRQGSVSGSVRRAQTDAGAILADLANRDATAFSDWERQHSEAGLLAPELEGLPLKRSRSGVKFNMKSLLDLSEELKRTGWAHQPISIAFENVKVFRNATDDVMPSVTRALTAPFRMCCSEKKQKTQRLGHGDGITGYVEPGEVLLVLGPPGSGCTTLLKTLAGRHVGLEVQKTKLLYNGKPTLREAGGRAIYMGEDDIHLAPLSVEKTFLFSAELGTADEFAGIAGFDRQGWNDMLVRTVMHLLSLDHAKDTVVGDALLRGVSGGEKKRVSIGEAQLQRPNLICLDGWSRGLDSAATLRISRNLRLIANTMKVAIVVSMYQVGPEMLVPGKGFDNVLVLNGGRQLYFGPVAGAEKYFAEVAGVKRPPRRTLPDFLSTVVDAAIQQSKGLTDAEFIRCGSICVDDPEVIETTEKARDVLGNKWIESPHLDNLRKKLRGTGGVDVLPGSALQGMHSPKVERADKYVERREPTSVRQQLRWVIWREKELTLANRKQYINARFGRWVFMGLLTGLTFFQLDNDKSGAYSRQGSIYNTMLNLGLGSFAAMPDMVAQRDVLYKQKDYQMIRPWVWYIGKFLFDLPFTILDTLIFGTIVYWMVGLNSAFSHFLIWLLILWIVNVMSAALIRMFTCLAPDLSLAQASSAGTLIILIFFCGFMLPKDSIPVYFKWCYWMSPYTYGLHALLINEYYDITLNCSEGDLIHIRIPPTPTGQLVGTACPIQTNGKDYIKSALNIEGDKVWILYDALFLVGFLVIFVLLTVYIVENISFAPAGSTVRYKPGKRRAAVAEGAAELDTQVPGERAALVRVSEGAPTRTQLRWSNVCYSVVDPENPKGDRKVLLHEISGVAQPGQMTALMGPSGAGKTTLMDVLALRKDMSNVTGTIEINGTPLSPEMTRCIGYVEQMDMHEPRCTVREALLFSAKLRLANGDPVAKVNEVVQLLGLESVQHAMIGSDATGGGLALETRKRVTIGVELVTEPRVLFMDEPTSGLDTAGALAVLRCARAVADTGRTVVMTIHQPSTELFEMFDALCLLQKGGHSVYFGPLHKSGETSGCEHLLEYFTRNSPDSGDRRYLYTDDQNPADFMLNVLGFARDHWPEVWPESAECSVLIQELGKDFGEGLGSVPAEPPVCRQISQLLSRTFVVFWRTPTYNITRNIFAVFTGLLLGSAYWDLGKTQKDLHNYVTVIYFTVILGVLNTMNALPIIIQGRSVFYREIASGTYRHSIYSMALAVVEVPFFAVASALWIFITYWMCNFDHDVETFGFFCLQYFFFVAFTVYWGQFMAAMCPSLMIAQMLIPVSIGLWTLYNGFLIREQDIPAAFKVFYIVNPYTYFLRGMVSNVLGQQSFYCDHDERLPVAWDARYAQFCNSTLSHGQLGDYNPQTGTCGLCPVTSGDTFLSFYGWHYDDRWQDFGILVGCTAVTRLLCTLALTYKRHIVR
eukprot:TRINITY_DN4012_c1_g1_i1.p1 TRINITY_DN4012_c1_g1~~TRINITY_DN4012_c1_g1_i1.p1  ORF type:complete len:1485 (+),score=432.39 TRINITY_DN4012_c1_g1_i1:120-4574(+)